jgi:hypothetical protein
MFSIVDSIPPQMLDGNLVSSSIVGDDMFEMP